MPRDEGARRRQRRHAVPRTLLEANRAHEPPVEGRVGALERLGPHVLVLEDVAQQAADLRIRRPPRDRLQVGREGADKPVVLRGIAPDLPRRQLALGKPAEEGVRHRRMPLDLGPQRLHERVRRDSRRDPVAHGPR
jgi:hypothetical protein